MEELNKENQKQNLQENFQKFMKLRKAQIKVEQKLKEKQNPLIDKTLENWKDLFREKIIQTAKKYYGVPYHPQYHKEPSSEHHNAKMYLDCCALVRKVVFDLREEFGFQLSNWNQSYQFDTLPISVASEKQLKKGDLIFIEATYNSKRSRRWPHDLVHVEIYTGEGEKTIGARWQKGVVQQFNSYKFKSKSFHSEKYHFKSIDTWLEGVHKSFCEEHKWFDQSKEWKPGKNSIFCTDADAEQEGGNDEIEELCTEIKQLKVVNENISK